MSAATEEKMRHIDPKETPLREVHQYMIGGISPRPIALVGTVSEDGTENLAPFSFFNAFGANPPMVAFSAARRGREGTLKDTYHNLLATKECTIQLVTYDIVEQVNLASAEVSPEINEFTLSGLTPVDSDLIRPKRVLESPYQMECRLTQMIPLGDGPGAGNLALCEVIRFHLAERLFDESGFISPDLLDIVGRNGGSHYTRASGDAIFSVPSSRNHAPIGWEGLPEVMRQSHVYTANDLARFATVEKIPSEDDLKAFYAEQQKKVAKDLSMETFDQQERDGHYQEMMPVALALLEKDTKAGRVLLERVSRSALHQGNHEFAWQAALIVTL